MKSSETPEDVSPRALKCQEMSMSNESFKKQKINGDKSNITR